MVLKLDIFLMDGTSSDELEGIQNVGEQITVQVSLEKPSFMVLSESYRPYWKAYIQDEEIAHLRASFWANGFYMSTIGDLEVRITFGLQRSRNLTVAIWIGSWTAVLTGFTHNGFSSRLYDSSEK